MKINFANQLRGLAAMLVVASHYILVYFVQNGIIASTIGSKEISVIPKVALDIAKFCLGYVNTGPVGVSVFFVISGFVISFSIEKNSKKEFLIQRFFRIFPAYWVSVLIGLGCVYLSCLYWGNSFWSVFNLRDYLINAALLNTILGVPMIDFVNWTLAIEIKFYLLGAIVFFAFSSAVKRLWVFVLFQAFVAILYWLGVVGLLHLKQSLMMILSESKHMSLMFIGLSLYNYMNKDITFRQVALMVVLYVVGFYCILFIDNDMNVMRVLSINYAIGLAIFFVSFTFRDKFNKNPFLDYMAEISYPLYLIHAVMGYVIISILYDQGCGYLISIIAAVTLSSILAFLLHKFVEYPANKFGKKITNNSKEY